MSGVFFGGGEGIVCFLFYGGFFFVRGKRRIWKRSIVTSNLSDETVSVA